VWYTGCYGATATQLNTFVHIYACTNTMAATGAETCWSKNCE